MSLVFFENLQSKFSFKVFFVFASFFSIISCAFIIFFTNHQKENLKSSLIKHGTLLSELLADNAKLGIYTGNSDLLRNSANSPLGREGVIETSIYTETGEVLVKVVKQGLPTNLKESLDFIPSELQLESLFSISKSVRFNEFRDRIEFWAPVLTSSRVISEEELLFDSPRSRDKYVDGIVRVTVSKGNLINNTRAALLRSISMGMILFLVGCVVFFFLAKMITRPVKAITKSANTLDREGKFFEVPVVSKDELGNLAKTFNNMASSLVAREQALQKSQAELRQLSDRILIAQEEERRRISRELHDELGQSLAFIKIQLESAENKIPESLKELRNSFQEMIAFTDQTIEDVRRLSHDLSPSILEDLGLTLALESQCSAFAGYHSMKYDLAIENIDGLFSQESQIILYRFCQEVLNNISKHAEANFFSIAIKKYADYTMLLITDDGKGFDMDSQVSSASEKSGLGLKVMDERARMLGGLLTIDSNPGDGTTVTLKIPLNTL